MKTGVVLGRNATPRWPWAILVLIFGGYVAAIVSLHPTNFFGVTEDDSIYFSSAKALAEGRGYVLPSVPGTPPATKYPVLYPLILSCVWKWNPSFPANLPLAIAVSVLFGMAYLTLGFVFLRRLRLLNQGETLLLTALVAFHPVVLFYSGSVLSDIPFAALALGAMVLADRAMEPDASPSLMLFCGAVAGLSMMMRMFGVAIVAGILTATLMRRTWNRAIFFSFGVAPFFVVIAWRIVFAVRVAPPVANMWTNSPGWMNAWAYYTNYFSIWKVGVPNIHIFWSIVGNNLGLLAIGPADLFLSPLLVGESSYGRTFAALLFLFFTLAGLARLARRNVGFNAMLGVLLSYIALIVLWNYPDAGNRFLLPFAFALLAGAWIETRHLFLLLEAKLFSNLEGTLGKVTAGILCATILFVGFITVLGYTGKNPGHLASLSDERGELLAAKRAAYEWLALRGCCAPVIAYEDVNVYLYAGRKSMRSVIFPTSAQYDTAKFEESVNHAMDIAAGLQSEYWVLSDDDYSVDFRAAANALSRCLGREGAGEWPTVFESEDGKVSIREVRGSGYRNPCGKETQ